MHLSKIAAGACTEPEGGGSNPGVAGAGKTQPSLRVHVQACAPQAPGRVMIPLSGPAADQHAAYAKKARSFRIGPVYRCLHLLLMVAGKVGEIDAKLCCAGVWCNLTLDIHTITHWGVAEITSFFASSMNQQQVLPGIIPLSETFWRPSMWVSRLPCGQYVVKTDHFCEMQFQPLSLESVGILGEVDKI